MVLKLLSASSNWTVEDLSYYAEFNTKYRYLVNPDSIISDQTEGFIRMNIFNNDTIFFFTRKVY